MWSMLAWLGFVSAAPAATISMTANNNYFAGWTWNKFPVPPNTNNCSGGTLPNGTTITGSLGTQALTVTSLQPNPVNWEVCPNWYWGSAAPANIGLSPPGNAISNFYFGVDSINFTTGDLLLTSATPLPAGSMLGLQDIDNNENAILTFKDCSNNLIDAANFDEIIISSAYTGTTGIPIVSYNAATKQWTFAHNGNSPNLGYGLLLKSNQICSIEVNSPTNGTSGGLTFYVGAPPLVNVTKTVDAATSPIPVTNNQLISYDLTVTNITSGISAATQPAGYQFYEIIPQNTTYTGISSGNATTDCPIGAVAGTLCTITLSNPVAAGAPQVVVFTVTTNSPLFSSTATSIFNAATQDATTIPSGCSAPNSVCSAPPTSCQGSLTCASVEVVAPVVTVSKSVNAATPNPVGAGQDVIYDLVLTNTTAVTSAAAPLFFDIVPQNTVFKSVSANVGSNCTGGEPAGTTCAMQLIPALTHGAPITMQFTVTTISPLPVGTTSIFNAAPAIALTQGSLGSTTTVTTLADWGCGTGNLYQIISGKPVCTAPPVGPTCPAGATCASAPTVTAALTVTKSVIGGPAGYSGSFPITAACTYDGTDISSQITPGATQTATAGTGSNGALTFATIPIGATCAVSEGALPTPPNGYVWGTPAIAPASLTISATAADNTATVVNTLTRQSSTINLTKTVTGGPAGGVSGTFNFNVDCGSDGVFGGSVVLGNATSGTASIANVPAAATCTVSEAAPPAAPANYQWGAMPASVTLTTTPSGPNAASFINTLTSIDPPFVLTKTISGGPAGGISGTFEFAIDCGAAGSFTQAVTLNNSTSGSVTISNIPGGTSCTFTEASTLPTAPSGFAWGSLPAAQTKTIDGTSLSFVNTLNAAQPATVAVPAPALRDGMLVLLATMLVLVGLAGQRTKGG